MRRALIVILSLFMALPALQAQSIDSHKELKKKIEQEISFINNQLKNLNTKQKTAYEIGRAHV